MPLRLPFGVDVPDPWSDDGSCLTWKVSVRARGRARRLLRTRPLALGPLRPNQDLLAEGTGVSLPLLGPHRLAAASAFLPRLVFLPALACLLPSPRKAHKFHPPFAFPGEYSSRVSPTRCARPLPTFAFSDSKPPAPNLSAVRSSSGRLPGGFPTTSRLARCPASPTPWDVRLPQPFGRSVRPSSPRTRILALLFLPRPCWPHCLVFAPLALHSRGSTTLLSVRCAPLSSWLVLTLHPSQFPSPKPPGCPPAPSLPPLPARS